jgi:hypothetical protein
LGALVTSEPEDFSNELPWPFHYVDSICYGADLLGDPAAIPVLKRIHSLIEYLDDNRANLAEFAHMFAGGIDGI